MAEPTSTSTSNYNRNFLVNEGKGGAVTLFPTVCYIKPHGGVEALNQSLKDLILEQEKAAGGLKRSSIRGGYHSDRKFFEQNHPAIKELRNIISMDAAEYLKAYWQHESTAPFDDTANIQLHLSGWSVVLREGDISVPHIHPRSNLSGVYYVTDTKDQEESFSGAGQLVLADPRIRADVFPIRNQASTAMFAPVAGTTVMFPSYLEHYVLPFRGKGERISIAFNLAFPPHLVGGDY